MTAAQRDGGPASYFAAWDRDYYESESRMFPHAHEVHGPYEVADEAELIERLRADSIDPETVRWEPVSRDDADAMLAARTEQPE